MMSYPRLGLVLGIDFLDATYDTKKLLDSLDDIVLEAGGAITPSKDARMSAAAFEASFPQWRSFAQFIDPKMTSSFWQRVAGVIE
jgi:FAD/FMN-containing dehydrogenase